MPAEDETTSAVTIPMRSIGLIRRSLHRTSSQIERRLTNFMAALVANANSQAQRPAVEHLFAQYLRKSVLSLVKGVVQAWAVKAEIVSSPLVAVETVEVEAGHGGKLRPNTRQGHRNNCRPAKRVPFPSGSAS